VTLKAPDNATLRRDLESFGRLHAVQWNVSGASVGDYILRFHFRDVDGFEMAGPAKTIEVLGRDEASGLQAQGDAGGSGGDSPGPGVALVVPALWFAVRLARSRRQCEVVS